MTGISNIAQMRVSLDGTDLTDRIAPRLNSLRLTEKRSGEADEIELEIDNADQRLAWPKAGRLLTVQLGWAQGRDVRVGMVDKGSFKVDEVSMEGPPDVLTVRARSADLTSAFRVRKDAAYHDTTLGEIIRKVAAANHLTPSIAPALASISIPVQGQTAKSDMALVRELGRRYDARVHLPRPVRSRRRLHPVRGHARHAPRPDRRARARRVAPLPREAGRPHRRAIA